MNKQALGIAMVYIGTIIGAGFASGLELYQFFGEYGVFGLIGILTSGFLFSLIGYFVLDISRRNKDIEPEDVVLPFNFKPLNLFISVFMGLFIFGIIIVMLAGAGAMGHQQYGTQPWLFSVIMAVLVILTSFTGREGIIKSFKMVVPILVVGMIVVIGITLVKTDWSQVDINATQSDGSWFMSAMLFVSYNMILTVAVLVPLGKNISKKRTAITGALGGGMTLGLLGLIAVLAMAANSKQLLAVEVPLAYLASASFGQVGRIYSILLFVGIYTTAVGCLFALEEKIVDIIGVDIRIVNTVIIVSALLLSKFGFSALVGTIYPISGYVGLIIIVGVALNFLMARPKIAKSAQKQNLRKKRVSAE